MTLMTLHNAKGLEFRAVFMIGMEEGIFPHARSIEEQSLEEERRLAYVGLTRAQERLTLLHASSRALYGGRNYNMASRFLDELPGEHVERERLAPTSWWTAARPRRRSRRGTTCRRSRPATTFATGRSARASSRDRGRRRGDRALRRRRLRAAPRARLRAAREDRLMGSRSGIRRSLSSETRCRPPRSRSALRSTTKNGSASGSRCRSTARSSPSTTAGPSGSRAHTRSTSPFRARSCRAPASRGSVSCRRIAGAGSCAASCSSSSPTRATGASLSPRCGRRRRRSTAGSATGSPRRVRG